MNKFSRKKPWSWICLLLFVVIIGGTLLWRIPQLVHAATSTTTETIVVTSAGNQSTKTMAAVGDVIHITATGKITDSQTLKSYGPEGDQNCIVPQSDSIHEYVAPGKHCYALIAMLGGNPDQVVEVGKEATFTATEDSLIYLQVNGLWQSYADGWTVTVTINPSNTTQFKAPYGINISSSKHTSVGSNAYIAACKGVSGTAKLQSNKQTGEVGYSVFSWGGLCGFYTKSAKPSQEASVESLVGNMFTAPVSGTYRISATINLQGKGTARTGSGAFDIISTLVPGKVGDALSKVGSSNLVPNVSTAQNSLILKVNSVKHFSSDGFPNIAVDTVLHPSQDETFSGLHTVSTTIKLNAGQQISIFGGITTDTKSWGNASTVVKTLNSDVDNIVVQQI